MTRKVSYIEKSIYLPLSFVLSGMIFARYCYYGFEYFYQLDDYIQYHNYRAYGGDLWGLVKSLGMLSSRPLAGIMDIFVWSEFYGCMIAAVAIISALYMASAIFFHMVFSKHFGTGYMFFVIYALLPLGFEGTYWISASSRIVVGAFFASLSLLFFDEWCEKGGKSRLAAFSVFQFIAFCFYEQVILLSGAATFAVMLCHAKKRGRERMRWGLLMFPNAAIYFTVTKIAPSGVYGQRAELFLPWQYGYKDEVFTPLLNQIKEVFIKGNAATLSKGLVRGFKLLVLEPNLIYVLIVLAFCFSLYMIVIN
ncbi:MAG: hypothetical protein GX488_08475, partial [Clostridiales bacterium]|nr:hypothetical protein [Clostridiales bacterium]